MAESRTITMDMLTAGQAVPTLVLRPPALTKRSRSSYKVLSTDYWKSIVYNAKEEMPTSLNERDTAENKKKLEKIFQNMKDDVNSKLEEMKDETLKEMEGMTRKEQELLINFWTGVGSFFKTLLGWVGEIFGKILDLLKQGWQLLKETIGKIFKPVTDSLTAVWNSLSTAFP